MTPSKAAHRNKAAFRRVGPGLAALGSTRAQRQPSRSCESALAGDAAFARDGLRHHDRSLPLALTSGSVSSSGSADD